MDDDDYNIRRDEITTKVIGEVIVRKAFMGWDRDG